MKVICYPSLSGILAEAVMLRPNLFITEALDYLRNYYLGILKGENGLGVLSGKEAQSVQTEVLLKINLATELKNIIQKQHDDFVESLICKN